MVLDDVDRGILYLLQKDAREMTAADLARQVGVSASTVRNRIARLEANGVIRGYDPDVDYEAAGFDLHLFVVCRVSMSTRSEVAREALDLPGVINVRELTTGANNLHVEVVAADSDAADEAIAGIEDLDAEIASTQVIKKLHVQPFDHFGSEIVSDQSTD